MTNRRNIKTNGDIKMNADFVPTEDTDVATKEYVDNALPANPVTVDISFGGTHKATNLAAPASGGDATNKTYVDAGDAASTATKIKASSSAPGTPANGQIYYDTDDNLLYFYNGADWLEIATVEEE